MSDQSGPVQTDSRADVVDPPSAPTVYPPDYPFAPQYKQEHLLGNKSQFHLDLPSTSGDAIPLTVFLHAWIAAAVFGGCLFNFVVGMLVGPSEPILLMASLFAAVLSQLALQSAWIVWSPHPLWLRQIAGLTAGWLLLGAFLVGLRLGNEGRISDFAELARAFLCSVPLIMLSAQIPLWALRTYLRWRILPTNQPATPDRPLTIGDMIAATLVVALAFGFIRLASDDPDFYTDAWVGWLIAIPSIAAISLVSLPPLLFLMLRRYDWPVVGLFAWCGYATVLLTVAAIVITFLSGRPDPEGIMLIYLAPLGAGTLTWLALWGLRACGYRLVIGSAEEIPV